MSLAPAAITSPGADSAPDLERRFGGLRRLYGDAAYARLRSAHVVVVGIGGVGSWAAEALARSGVAALTLVDLDQVAESNINRQVQALGRSVGMAKVDAMAERIADIHPGCRVTRIEEFVAEDNWPTLLAQHGVAPFDVLIDACDQGRAKLALAAWQLGRGGSAPRSACVSVGAAGGKQHPQAVEVADLAEASHDPLLANLRQRLRRLGAPRQGALGLRCVFSREAVAPPADAACAADAAPASDGSLNCHGYGSSVMVTAAFGLAAAAEAVRLHLASG